MPFASAVSRILAYRSAVDMRKSFAGLLGVVRSVLDEDPLSPTLFVFFNRRGNYMKAIYFDRTGFCLFAKKLERGRFVLRGDGDRRVLSEREFRLLLDGIPLGNRTRMR